MYEKQEKDNIREQKAAASDPVTGVKKAYQRPAWEVENAEPEAGMGCSKANDMCSGPVQS